MKTIILAGGLGTRISEETENKPKPMVLIDDEPFETGALPRIVNDRQLMSYHHHGFWQPMDTLREKRILEEMVFNNRRPWLDHHSNE